MPLGVVTVMSIFPVLPGGDTAVMDVGLFTTNEAAAAMPKLTAVAPLRFVPEIVTLVLPDNGPLFGEIEVKVGQTR